VSRHTSRRRKHTGPGGQSGRRWNPFTEKWTPSHVFISHPKPNKPMSRKRKVFEYVSL